METIRDIITAFGELFTVMFSHTPFVSAMIGYMLVGQFMKNYVFTRQRAMNFHPKWFWWWGRKSMVLHPTIAGLALGVVWRAPEVGYERLVDSMGYFALAGSLSTFVFVAIQQVFKNKGWNFELPGESLKPPDK